MGKTNKEDGNKSEGNKAEGTMTHYFPLFIDLRGREVLMVGGGRIAVRRAAALAAFGAAIRVVAETVDERLRSLAIEVIEQRVTDDELDRLLTAQYRLVLAVTSDSALNSRIGRLCRERGIAVNVCDSPTDCDFFFPAIAMNEAIAVGITSSGQDHHQVARVAKQIRAVLEDKAVLENREEEAKDEYAAKADCDQDRQS